MDNEKPHNDLTNNLFLANLLNTLPQIDSMQDRRNDNGNRNGNGNGNRNGNGNMNGNNMFSNILDPFSNGRSSNNVLSSYGGFNLDASNPIDIFNNSGNQNLRNHISNSNSPHTNSSSCSPQSVGCGQCDNGANNRCLDCNAAFCDNCIQEHNINAYTKNHTVVGLGKITPIGSVTSTTSMMQSMKVHPLFEPQCDIHFEALRFLCETCKKVVCQECTLMDHKDHEQTPIGNITTEMAKERLRAVYNNSVLGTQHVRKSIDHAVAYSQSIERDSQEIQSRIKKSFRLMTLAAEDRERALVELIEKFRQQKVANLSDQMTGLRSALAGLAKTSDCLGKSIDSVTDHTSKIDVAFLLANTQSQVETFAAMYKNLQPKEETLTFIQPSFELIQEIRNQGEIVINCRNNMNFQQSQPSNGANVVAAPPVSTVAQRQISRASNSPNNGDQFIWDSNNGENGAVGGANGAAQATQSKMTYASIVKPAAVISGQCIPGSSSQVVARPTLNPRLTFCMDGHEDGKVSRPWGVCVNKSNEIIIADRRNNRIQIFFADGTFKLKFGAKGTGNGQFDLPAGVATDSNNRIIVVDKDNHRVQVFSSTGVFILKFGAYGKELSQFMYPWACAVNTKSQILVTDSRNHRIQLFSPDGHFISRFSFDGLNHSRYLKGLTTPRGVAFTPDGNIIISDFENHRLILIDSSMTKIIATRGNEGSAPNEFCRPSGICCDDKGRIIIADSKNQRVLIYSPTLDCLWNVEIRPSSHNILTSNLDEKDRPSDVALLNDGRLVVLVETSPDSREVISPYKTFVQVY